MNRLTSLRVHRWLRSGLQWTATLIMAILAFQLASHLRASPQPTAEPFYLERTYSIPNSAGHLVLSKRMSVARRSDGLTATIMSVGPLALGHTSRIVTFLDGSSISLYDSIKMKSTWPVRSSGNPRVQPPTEVPNDCGGSLMIGTPGFAFKGYDHILGRDVAVFIVTTTDGMRFTASRAPSLGCEVLHSVQEVLQPDGSTTLLGEATVTEIIPGEPDSRLVDLGNTYVEALPSVAQGRMISEMRLALPQDELQQINRQGLKADRSYNNRRHGNN